MPIPILTYHQISLPPAKGARFRSLCVSPAAFARQMALLKLLGYQGLSMTALLPYLKGEKNGKVVGITFDDGYLNNLTHALPVLQRYGFSSTCYVVSQLLGKSNVWDSAQGVAQVPLMTGSELEKWLAGGQEVGAHSRTHAHLPELDLLGAEQEITDSKVELHCLLGAPVEHFCYPFGQYAQEHVDLVRVARYQSATTTQRGRCKPGADLLQLPRVPVVRSTSLLMFGAKVLTSYEDRRQGK